MRRLAPSAQMWPRLATRLVIFLSFLVHGSSLLLWHPLCGQGVGLSVLPSQGLRTCGIWPGTRTKCPQADNQIRLGPRNPSCVWRCTAEHAADGNERERDLVVLVGFLGSTFQILSKYSGVYEDLGAETKIVVPSIPSMFLAHQGFRGRGSFKVRQLCKRLQAESQKRRVILHVFSNNGFIFLASCLRTDPSLRTQVSGIILDSCPSLITADVAATGLIAALTGRDGGAAKQSRLFRAARGLLGPVLGVVEERQAAAWDAWEVNTVLAPHLFLYSEGDAVIPAAEVEQHIVETRERLEAEGGFACVSQRWKEPEHCAILRVDPDGYAAVVADFITNTVEKDSPGRTQA